MKTRLNRMQFPPAGLLRTASAALALLMLFTTPQASAADVSNGRMIVGTWYLALDAGPFDPNLAGTFLSGIAQFHADRTFMISDAGDFGADSFLQTLATPQYGVWQFHRTAAHSSRRFEGTSIVLEAHKDTGEALGWNKVHFSIRVVGDDRAEGTINVFFLPCAEALPVPTPLSCPDPIENAGSFIPASPPDVPIILRRVVVGQ